MGKNLKILIIGLGSIGHRHLSHLKNISGLELAALRTKKGEVKKEGEIKEFFNVEDGLNYNPDGVLISNPTSLHVETAIPFLKNGCRVLIEKPIDTSIKNATLLKPFEDQLKVAYCMRFHPLNLFLKSKFAAELPFKVGFKRSYYLPKWHPYADYRKEYTAKKSLGGGVIRTLSHEIDLALDWFGFPKKVDGVVDKVSFLEIDTDDYAFFSIKSVKNTRVNFELDFFSPLNVYSGEAFTQEGKYEWNLEQVFFTSYEKGESEIIFSVPLEAAVEMYQKQMDDFVQFVSEGRSKNASFNGGINVLKLIEDIENN